MKADKLLNKALDANGGAPASTRSGRDWFSRLPKKVQRELLDLAAAYHKTVEKPRIEDLLEAVKEEYGEELIPIERGTFGRWLAKLRQKGY